MAVVLSVVASCTVVLAVCAPVGMVCASPGVVSVAMPISKSVVALLSHNCLAIVMTVAVPVAEESLHIVILTVPCVLSLMTVMTIPHSLVLALLAAIFRCH